jgi:hypothetical protein
MDYDSTLSSVYLGDLLNMVTVSKSTCVGIMSACTCLAERTQCGSTSGIYVKKA